MKTKLFLAIMLTTLLSSLSSVAAQPNLIKQSAAAARSSTQDQFVWRQRIQRGLSVEIQGIKGNVLAEAASGEEVEVFAVKRGTDDTREVNIQTVWHDGGVTICAVYPDFFPHHKPFTCRPGEANDIRDLEMDQTRDYALIKFGKGSEGEIRFLDVEVDFIVRVPAGVRFIGRTFVGDVIADLPLSDITAQCATSNVIVGLSETAAATIRATNTTGQIESDFKLSTGKYADVGTSARGSFGGGIAAERRRLMLNTVWGTIRLYRTP
jgi:hypothetical protein